MQNIINEKMKNNRIYIAIDLKSFYASVECVERGLDPLTTNLVVADASRTEKTICLAVSPSLKAYGISGRARLFEVVQKVNEIKKLTGRQIDYIVASPRMHKYIEVSAAIYEEYLKYVSSEDIHVYSIDEVFIDITDYLTLYEMTSYEITVNIIHNIYEKTRITATAGIGTNLYLAKIAMDIMAKHVQADADGVRIASLDEMTYRKYLWNHTPITDFWRVGKGIASRLEQSGIYTMGDIARTSLHNAGILSDMFGVDAQLLIDHAWGYEPCTIADIKKYKPSTNSISSGQVLGCAYDYDRARIVVKEMADEIALELVSERKVTQSVTLTLGYDRIDDNTVDIMVRWLMTVMEEGCLNQLMERLLLARPRTVQLSSWRHLADYLTGLCPDSLRLNVLHCVQIILPRRDLNSLVCLRIQKRVKENGNYRKP